MILRQLPFGHAEDILLNDKPVFLRGICIHEENPMRGGRVYSVGDTRMLLGWAKEMNANFVRLAHYPTTSTWPAWPTSWAY
jgi:beta-galactosidase/beta-glucuronidase